MLNGNSKINACLLIHSPNKRFSNLTSRTKFDTAIIVSWNVSAVKKFFFNVRPSVISIWRFQIANEPNMKPDILTLSSMVVEYKQLQEVTAKLQVPDQRKVCVISLKSLQDIDGGHGAILVEAGEAEHRSIVLLVLVVRIRLTQVQRNAAFTRRDQSLVAHRYAPTTQVTLFVKEVSAMTPCNMQEVLWREGEREYAREGGSTHGREGMREYAREGVRTGSTHRREYAREGVCTGGSTHGK